MNGVLRAQAQRFVDDGARYLDDEAARDYPEIISNRWYHAVNLNILDMAADTHCLLAQIGQACERYALLDKNAVAAAIGMKPEDGSSDAAMVRYGFRAFPGDGEEQAEVYRELTLAWKMHVLRRRAQDPAWTLALAAG
jgi:hypothetical protein